MTDYLSAYIPLVPPCNLNYDDWTRKEALAYLAWFVKQVPIRAKYIVDFVAAAAQEPDLHALSPHDKLVSIWRWFLQVAETEPVSQEERDAQAPFLAKFGPSFVCYTQFTLMTEYIMRDIGMLFAQLLLDISGQLDWTVVSKPRKYVWVNRPILDGFLDTNYTPPYKAQIDPLHMVGVQAGKIISGSPTTEMDLARIFSKWAAKVPK